MTIRLVSLGVVAVAGSLVGCATGHWEGKLQTPARELGMTVDLARDAKGFWIEVRAASGMYRGTLGAGEIAGEWLEGSVRLPLTMKRTREGK